MCNLLVLLLIATASGIPLDQFFKFNRSKLCLIDAITGLIHIDSKYTPGLPEDRINSTLCLEFSICPNDDASSHSVDLTFPFPFFAKRFINAFVSYICIVYCYMLCIVTAPNYIRTWLIDKHIICDCPGESQPSSHFRN